MDVFLEKIVRRKKTILDIAIMIGIVLLAFVLLIVIMSITLLRTLMPIFLFGVIYLAYIFIRNRNIEYEYILTNGDLDIDMIIAQRKRKRILSANCKDFEMLAKLTSGQYTRNIEEIKERVVAVTSMESQDVYFVLLSKEGKKTLVFFEPHAKMVESFKRYIPRKVFE